MKKFISGKVSFSILLTIFVLLGAFFLGKALTKVSATVVDSCVYTCSNESFSDSHIVSGYDYKDKVAVDTSHWSDWKNGFDHEDNSQYRHKDGNSWGDWASCTGDCHNYLSDNRYQFLHRDWITETSYQCPTDYTNNPGHDNCRKETSTTETFGPIDVPYTKWDADPHKCHRETAGSLGVPSWAESNFNTSLKEFKDATKSAPAGYYMRDGVCYPNSVDCAYHYTSCPVSCGEGVRTLVIDTPASGDGEACPTEETISCGQLPACEVDQCTNIAEFQSSVPEGDYQTNKLECFEKTAICNDKTATNYERLTDETYTDNSLCKYPSSTPAPLVCGADEHLSQEGTKCLKWELGGAPGGGGTSGGAVLGASTVAGQGQVLGASTMAGTGTFEEGLYLAIMGLGGITSSIGAIGLKKASKKA